MLCDIANPMKCNEHAGSGDELMCREVSESAEGPSVARADISPDDALYWRPFSTLSTSNKP